MSKNNKKTGKMTDKVNDNRKKSQIDELVENMGNIKKYVAKEKMALDPAEDIEDIRQRVATIILEILSTGKITIHELMAYIKGIIDKLAKSSIKRKIRREELEKKLLEQLKQKYSIYA